jgi:hypothetical protein
MTADERVEYRPEDKQVSERSVGQELASGQPENTPFTLLASVVAVVAVVVTLVLALVVVVVLVA